MTTIINAWNISSNSYIFENCTTVVNVNCNNISWVDNRAINTFANCPNLKKVTGLNDNLTNIHRSFYNCQNLVTVDHLPNNLTVLDSVFEKCISLKDSPAIPESVTTLYSTYSNCYSLQNAPVIPENVTNMKWTFLNCQNLTTPPAIPNSVKDMTETFYNAGLTVGANIPNSVTTVENTYRNCTKLTDAGSLPHITNLVRTYETCRNLVNAPVIPNSVTTMTATFEGCTSLSNIPTLPHSVTNLSYTFHDCTNLSNMPAIPNSITTLDHTFKNCSRLTNLQSIPLSVRNMAGTFQNCTNLPSSLIILSKDVTNAVDCFNGTSNVRKDVFMPFQYVNNTYTPTYNAFVAAGYSTTDYSKDNTRIHDMDIANVTVYPIPTDANVIFNAPGYTQSGHMITVRKKSDTFLGVPVDWVVNRWGYRNESGNLVPEKDVRIDVTMQKVPFTLTVNPEPADATVTLIADGYTQEGNSITVPYETLIHWRVAKSDYFVQEEDLILEDNTELKPILIKTHYLITIIPTPSDATVTLTCPGAIQQGNTILAPFNSDVQFTITRDGYQTKSGIFSNVDAEITQAIELTPLTAVVLDTNTPGSSQIIIPYKGIYEVLGVGAGGGGAALKENKSAVHGGDDFDVGSGGSGALVKALYVFNKDQVIPYTVGNFGTGVTYATGSSSESATILAKNGTTTSLSDYLVAGGGTGGQASSSNAGNVGGTGGTYTYKSVRQLLISQAGNNGTAAHGSSDRHAEGGASLYLGYGKGGSAYSGKSSRWAEDGIGGYLSVTYIGPDTIELTSPVTTTITIPMDGVYDIWMVGGGGGGAWGWTEQVGDVKVGSSAGYIQGRIRLSAGNYSVTVGKGGNGQSGHGYQKAGDGTATTFNGNIAGGGGGGYAFSNYGPGGTCTVVSQGLTGSNGTAGGTESRYGNYGGGGTAVYFGAANPGQNGYFKLVWVST